MDYAEQETAVEELEQRVERLRALYEQYFMGIEKIEPLIPRKDVDRRIWLLRREKIRNTGLRFKMQQVISRYNTFAQYWARILREIENGTYKRDVAKAAKRFGADADALSKKKLNVADLERLASQQAEEDHHTERARQRSYDLSDDDLDADEDTSPFRRSADGSIAAASTPAAPAAAAARGPRAPVQQLPVELEDDDDLFAGLNLSSAPPPPPAKPSVVVPMPAASPRPSAPVPPRPSAPVPPMPPRPSVPVPPRPSAPMPAVGSAPVPPMPPRPSVPVSPRPSAPVPPMPPRPAAPASQAPPRPAAAAPSAPRPAPPARPSAPVGGGELSDARVREIYSRYVDAKRQCNESTAAITVEGLAKSLRESAPKIREKHGGKSVDFDVVIKDGRAVLKPVLKT